jgi:hypothetical protein
MRNEKNWNYTMKAGCFGAGRCFRKRNKYCFLPESAGILFDKARLTWRKFPACIFVGLNIFKMDMTEN